MTSLSKPVTGVWAALLTPRTAAGSADQQAFARHIEFLCGRGVTRVVVNGATGEYCRTTLEQLKALLEVLRASGVTFLCGIGSADLDSSVAMGQAAFRAGARAVLLPAPYFFPYSQQDLSCYFRTVAEAVGGPVLLYNLPRFTTPIEPRTALEVIRTGPPVVGIKDSSGSLDILRLLTAEGPAEACRIVGDDHVLTAALREGVCDGVISGVASVLPELITFLFEHASESGRQEYLDRESQLEEFIAWLSRFPVPWGLKWAAEWRGLAPTRFPLPLTEERRKCAEAFREWFCARMSRDRDLVRV